MGVFRVYGGVVLRLYRRHRRTCPQRSERYRRCACPIYVAGTLAGEHVRKALDLTSWTAATDVVARWNEAGEISAGCAAVGCVSAAGGFSAAHPNRNTVPSVISAEPHMSFARVMIVTL